MTDEKAQLKQEGAVEDSTVPAGEIVKTQVTVETVTNAITTTAAASLYESATSTKVLANIPAGTSLLYDTATNNATYYNVNYSGQNGYVKKSLCRAATDAEAQKLQTNDTTKTVTVDAPVSGLFGLGYVEPMTLAAIAGTVSTITGLVASVAKAFDKDKAASVAETVNTTTKLAQGIATNIKQAKTTTTSDASKSTSNSQSKVAAFIDKGMKIADTVKQITADFAPTKQVEPTYISPASSTSPASEPSSVSPINQTPTETESASSQPQTTTAQAVD